jgi:hypothetical protein
MKISKLIPITNEKAISVDMRGNSKLVSLQDEKAAFYDKAPLVELTRDEIISNLSRADEKIEDAKTLLKAIDSFICDSFIQDDDIDEYHKDKVREVLRLLDRVRDDLEEVKLRIDTPSLYLISGGK